MNQYKNGGWNHSLHGRTVIGHDYIATVCFKPNGDIDHDKTSIVMDSDEVDAGWEIIRQFVEDLGYEAKIVDDPAIDVRGRVPEKSATICIQGGELMICSIVKVRIRSTHYPDNTTYEKDAKLNISSEKISLFAPGSLDVLTNSLKELLDA